MAPRIWAESGSGTLHPPPYLPPARQQWRPHFYDETSFFYFSFFLSRVLYSFKYFSLFFLCPPHFYFFLFDRRHQPCLLLLFPPIFSHLSPPFFYPFLPPFCFVHSFFFQPSRTFYFLLSGPRIRPHTPGEGKCNKSIFIIFF